MPILSAPHGCKPQPLAVIEIDQGNKIGRLPTGVWVLECGDLPASKRVKGRRFDVVNDKIRTGRPRGVSGAFWSVRPQELNQIAVLTIVLGLSEVADLFARGC